MNGKLYGVGVGPGDPELLTHKAERIIRECGVIAVPNTGENELTAFSIAQKAVPEISGKEILELMLPMSRSKILLETCHEAAAERVMRLLSSGINVAFLTLGDPTVYSTYIYIHKKVIKMGGQAEIVPGVTSFCAAAARLGISLAEAGEPIHIIPGSYSGASDGLDLPGTKVLMKTGRSFSKIKRELQARNLLAGAKMVNRCGLSGEQVVEDLMEAKGTEGYFSIIIVKDE